MDKIILKLAVDNSKITATALLLTAQQVCTAYQWYCTATLLSKSAQTALHFSEYCTAQHICTALERLHCYSAQQICTAYKILHSSALHLLLPSLHCTAYSACQHRTKRIQLVWFQGLSWLHQLLLLIITKPAGILIKEW